MVQSNPCSQIRKRGRKEEIVIFQKQKKGKKNMLHEIEPLTKFWSFLGDIEICTSEGWIVNTKKNWWEEV